MRLLAIVFGCKSSTHICMVGLLWLKVITTLGNDCLKNLISAPVQLQRMLLRLQQYDMVITYRPGKEMLLADALSHLPSRANNSEIKLDLWVNAISFTAFSSSRLTKTAAETQKDPILSTVHWLMLMDGREYDDMYQGLHAITGILEMSSLSKVTCWWRWENRNSN